MGSNTRPKPFGKLLAPFLYVFARPKKPQNNITVVNSKPKTFFVIEKSKGFLLVG